MALEVIRIKREDSMDTYEVTQRLCRTEDDRLVPEDHPDARWLYAIPGHVIPLAEARKYGLMDGEVGEVEVESGPEPEAGEQSSAEPGPEPEPEASPETEDAPRRRRKAG